jgi:TRAP-type C4-dicarboxylate transport system permease small subunit
LVRRFAPDPFEAGIMQKLMLNLSSFLDRLTTICIWAAGTGLVFMTAFIAWQVFGRYVLNDTPTWTESTSVMIMGWFIFLGAAVGIREGYHLSFDVILYFLPRKFQLILFSISDVVVAAFSLGMVIYGWQLMANAWNSTIPNIGISGGVVFLSLTMGGGLIFLFSLERLARRASGLPTRRFGDAADEEI